MRTKLVWTFLVISMLGFTAPSLAASTKGRYSHDVIVERLGSSYEEGL